MIRMNAQRSGVPRQRVTMGSPVTAAGRPPVDPTAPIRFEGEALGSFAAASRLEWIEANGLGGWASSSAAGAHTRRYHGLLVAATRPPLGRMVLLSKLDETVDLGPERIELGANQFPGAVHPQGHRFLHAFARGTFPVFEYRVRDVRLEKTVAAIHGRNTTVVAYRLLESPAAVTLELRPLIAGRAYHSLRRADGPPPGLAFGDGALRAGPFAGDVMLHVAVPGGRIEPDPDWWYHFEYPRERERGLDHYEDLWTPGVVRVTLAPGQTVGVIVSTDDPAGQDPQHLLEQERGRRERLLERLPRRDSVTVPLARAADQFVVRRDDGHRTIIAGYHWFGDWGRDTLIALPGLTLATGRTEDARLVLQTLARHLDRGMLPNRFPDDGHAPEYNAVDATLWFFVALRAYVRSTADASLATGLLPMLRDVIRWHREGTRYGIRVDGDGLLRAGEPGVQLTWMDARVGDRVITPRIGKPVEINALWYNALRILAEFESAVGDRRAAAALRRDADRVHRRFSRTFWYPEGGYLYDVVDGDMKDASLRPNQILACSLPFPLLSAARRRRVLRVVEAHLLTPVGLRSLAPSHPGYRARYDGDGLARDSAYHQGTVWPWLLGPWVTAVVRERGERGRVAAAALIEGAMEHLSAAGVGTFSEIFDGDPPHAPRGAIAQAWSVAELLRAWVEDVHGASDPGAGS
jgi:predicted glycogen debranching enzyme